MKVCELMSRHVATVSPSDNVARAAKLMSRYDVGAIPVVKENCICGIVTDRDIVLRTVVRERNPEETQVRDIMTCVTSTVSPEDSIGEALAQMSRRQIRRLLVLDKGRFVGILSLADIARAIPSVEVAQAICEISLHK